MQLSQHETMQLTLIHGMELKVIQHNHIIKHLACMRESNHKIQKYQTSNKITIIL
jgi:hypothetical protein